MNRLMLRITVGMVLVLGATFALNSTLMHWRMGQALEEATVPHARLVGQLLSIPLEHVPPAKHANLVQRMKKDLDLPVKIVTLDDPSIPEDLRPRLKKGQMAIKTAPEFQNQYFVPRTGSDHVLVVGPNAPFHPLQWYELLMVAGGMLVIVVLAGWALTRPLVRKLRLLEDAASRISAGELDARAAVGGSDPIGAFATRFNQMAERNQQMLEKRRQILQAVSHELRTPTARIRFGLEMLQNAKDDAEREARLEAIDGDLQELDDLVEELLLFNRLESEGEGDEHRPLMLLPVLEQARNQLQHLRSDLLISFEEDPPADLSLKANPKLFVRAIRNLLANAIRHAKTQVVISAKATGPWLEIQVRDDGPGVPESKRQLILEPFARLDESRSRDSGGAGLGLAIVQRIVQSHKAELEIGDAPEGGAMFITRWPL